MHDKSAKGADGLLRREHELQTGGKPTKPLYPSTIKFPGLAQTQIPLRPRDLSQSVGRGRRVAQHATDTKRETDKGKIRSGQSAKQTRLRESSTACVARWDQVRSPHDGACSRSRTVGWPPGALPTLARTSLTHHLASKLATSKRAACRPLAGGNQQLQLQLQLHTHPSTPLAFDLLQCSPLCVSSRELRKPLLSFFLGVL